MFEAVFSLFVSIKRTAPKFTLPYLCLFLLREKPQNLHYLCLFLLREQPQIFNTPYGNIFINKLTEVKFEIWRVTF